MLTQSREQIAGEIALLHDPPTNRDDDHSMGVPRERVDAHTLEVIRLLFKEKGLLFLAALLRQAQVKQRALPGLGVADCAVITAKTIRELATRISQPGSSWSYDTTEKYLVIFCALGFLSKRKSPDGIEYFFPLQPYTPPATLDVLDSVIQNYRKKVQSLGNKVKRRFVVYLVQQQSPISSLPVPVGPPFDLLGAEEDIEQIMQEELGTGALQERLLLKICGVLRYRCQSSSEQKGTSSETAPKNGRLPLPGDDSLPTTPDATLHAKSPIFSQKGDFAEMASTNGRLFSPKGDSLPVASQVTAPEKSPIPLQKGDFSGATAQKSRPSSQTGDSTATAFQAMEPKKSPVSKQKGDSSPAESPQKERLSARAGRFTGQNGDSPSEGAPNVNVILRHYIDSFLNDNDKGKVVEVLRTIFGEGPGKRGYYHNLYKNGYRDPMAWLAAAIETLIASCKKTTERPGNYFYNLCVTFHQQGVPQDAMERAQHYGSLPYEQLLEVLERPTPSIRPLSSSHALRLSSPTPLELRIPRAKDRSGMDREALVQAYHLLHGSPFMLRVAAYRQHDGTEALLVDDRMGHQCWLYSQQALAVNLPLAKNAPDLLARLSRIGDVRSTEERSDPVESRRRS